MKKMILILLLLFLTACAAKQQNTENVDAKLSPKNRVPITTQSENTSQIKENNIINPEGKILTERMEAKEESFAY